MSRFKILLIILLVFSCSSGAFANSQKIEKASCFMHEFQELSHKYDKSLPNMYSDDAKIIRNLVYSDGKTEKVIFSVQKYKKILKFIRVLAKFKRYKNYYKNLAYKIEDQNVRITGIRETSNGYKSPISMLVSTHEWKILEEETDTKSIFLVKKVLSK